MAYPEAHTNILNLLYLILPNPTAHWTLAQRQSTVNVDYVLSPLVTAADCAENLNFISSLSSMVDNVQQPLVQTDCYIWSVEYIKAFGHFQGMQHV